MSNGHPIEALSECSDPIGKKWQSPGTSEVGGGLLQTRTETGGRHADSHSLGDPRNRRSRRRNLSAVFALIHMTGLSQKLLSVVIGGAAIVLLAVVFKPVASESEPVVTPYRPISADKGGGCASENWPHFSPGCLRSGDTSAVRTVTSTTLLDPGPINTEVIVLPSKARPALAPMEALAQWETNVIEKPRKAQRIRAAQEPSRERVVATNPPILYGQ